MGTHRQTLLHDLSTLVACLRGEVRVDSYHLVTGSLSLILKNSEKRAPTGVHDGFGKLMVLHHSGDSQVFNDNALIGLSIRLGRLKVMVTTLTVDLEMGLCCATSGFPASVTALLATGDHTLLASQGALTRAIETRVLNHVAFTIGQEGLEPHVNTDSGMLARRWQMLALWFSLTDDESIPVPISTIDKVYRPGCSLDGTVQLDFEEMPQLLRDNEVLLILVQIAIFAVLSQLDGVPTSRLFETREPNTRNVILFGSKKPFEAFCETISQHLYRGGWHLLALSFESIFKVILGWECTLLFIVLLDQCQHLIVDATGFDQALHEQSALLCIHEKAILKRSHSLYYMPLESECQQFIPPTGGRQFIPIAEARGPLAAF